MSAMSEKSDRPKVPTAKWGAACAPCATAKAKCIRTNLTPDSKCDRCERLFKDCSDQVHRPRKKRQVKPSRTAQIEERLNGLVNLLKASGELPPGERPLDSAYPSIEIDPSLSGQRTPSETPSGSVQPGQNPWSIPETYNSYAPPSCTCRPKNGDVPPPPDTDEALLKIYQTELQRVYPFVVVPSHVSAAALKTTRPFLMSAIRMVASFKNMRSMRAQMYHLMKHLTDYMLIRSEKSLDLLQGIIVIAGWYQYHCFMHAQLNNLITLALALVGDLGLNRTPRTSQRSAIMMVNPIRPAARNNDERRALAGVWFLTSSMSISFFRIESMRFTSYLQECLKELENAGEHPSDVVLIYLVRIQHLTERIYQLNAKDPELEDVSGLPTPPLSAYMASFRSELDRIRDGLPDDIKSDNLFMSYYYTANLRLYEPPIVDTTLVTSISNWLINSPPGETSPLDQVYQSRNALLAWLDNWLAVPSSMYYCQITTQTAQIVYGLTMLGRWARLAAPTTVYESRSSVSPGSSAADNTTENLMIPSFGAGSQASESGASPRGIWYAPLSTINTDTCMFGQVITRQATDPKLPPALAILRSQLKDIPGLAIDIPRILEEFCSRFEEADAIACENGQSEYNVWSMGAIKVRITQAKLERWADLVTQGAQALSLEDRPVPDTTMTESRTTHVAGGDPGPDGYVQGTMPQEQLSMQSFAGNTPWGNDMMQNVDPAVWFDGYLDWSTVCLNSMGNIEQER